MMYFTNEHTTLKSQNGGEDITLYPGINQAFAAFEGEYIATSSAYIKDFESGKIIQTIEVGKIINSVGVVVKKKAPPRKAKESLLESEDG